MSSTIQSTQEQARDLAAVALGDLRHWRQHVPFLADEGGKSAHLTFTDLLGIAVTRELVAIFGGHIFEIGSQVNGLFHCFGEARVGSLRTTVAAIDADGTRLLRELEFVFSELQKHLLFVSREALISRMARQMIPASEMIPDQAFLSFPPWAMGDGA